MSDNLRYWYEHELCRLRAAERAGFNVTKEIAELKKLLDKLPAAGRPKDEGIPAEAFEDVRALKVTPPGFADWTKP